MIRKRGILFVTLVVLLGAVVVSILSKRQDPGLQLQAGDVIAEEVVDAVAGSRRPLFEDWPKPALTLFITGRQNGYIEPCGCTGLASQKGGLARRYTLLTQLRSRGWDVVPIDVGNQVRRFGMQPAIKFQTTIDALQKMGYRAVGLGADDLRLSIGELIAAIGVDGEPGPLVSANVNVLGFNRSHQIVRTGPYTIGIASVLGSVERQAIQSDEIEFSTPEEGLRRAHAAFKQENCNIMVLLAYASTAETNALAAQFPDFRIVVTAGGADEPALQPEKIPGTRSYLVQTGKKGMYVGVLGIFDDPRQPMRYQRVPLDSRFADSPEMLQSLAAYQQQLKDMGLSQLGLKPVVHPSGHLFVGSAVCQDCHEDAYDVWSDSPHHEATHSIAHPTERSDIARHHDPECLSCHVTGWSPQGYFPYESGYWDLETSTAMHGNGCENCHGPGSAHVAAENGEGDPSEAQLLTLRGEMKLPLAKARDVCLECHDLDNDPDFQKEEAFAEYWEQIEH